MLTDLVYVQMQDGKPIMYTFARRIADSVDCSDYRKIKPADGFKEAYQSRDGKTILVRSTNNNWFVIS